MPGRGWARRQLRSALYGAATSSVCSGVQALLLAVIISDAVSDRDFVALNLLLHISKYFEAFG